jgi:2-polyprenyl-3-methyl-5-hydroxy-6-metoxy-1,4-benzoquinol methylase
MAYVNPRLSNEHIVRLYQTDYFHNIDYGYENYDLNRHLRIKNFERWFGEVLPYLNNAGTKNALDIGCASGDFLAILRKNGWNAYGIELDKKIGEELNRQGYSVSDSPLEKYSSSVKFDLITLFDVLEHLIFVHDDIQKLADMLSPSGTILLVTPDIESRQRKLFGKRWFQFKPREHINYFSPATLDKVLDAHGLKIVSVKPCGQYADVGFLSSRLERYGFKLANSVFLFFMKLTGLHKKFWYADTGSMLAVIQKK